MKKHFLSALQILLFFISGCGFAIGVNTNGREQLIAFIVGGIFLIMFMIACSCEKAIEQKEEK
ncbi:MAG: hypothetical protein IKW58_02130 [Alphaproteobacteria bacterium]|nr:hypothetical protein [Alphaproteobacteria bacterium]